MSTRPISERDEERILILAPSGRDGALAQQILAANGLDAVVCANLEALCDEAERGAGALLVAEEALFPRGVEQLAAQLADQPPWSDLPILVIVHHGVRPASIELLRPLRNATPLERPLRILALLGSLNAALRARRRQYDIRGLMAELRDASRAKDDFLAMVSHELRTPLNVIRGLSWSLANNHVSGDALAKTAATIDRNAQVLTRLVEDLLDLSRLQKRRFRLNVGPVDLHAVVVAAVEINQLAADARRVRLERDLATERRPVSGDALRLEQVVSNLLANAIKFTPAGGVVTVRLEYDVSHARITVSDTGDGIPADFLPYVFEPFRQQRPGDGPSAGLGLGLALVRQFVELHGGTVTAESGGPGRGATFTARLPAPIAADLPTAGT
jgi:signal transduction histidine kinase